MEQDGTRLDYVPLVCELGSMLVPTIFSPVLQTQSGVNRLRFQLLHPPLATFRLVACGQTKQPTGRQCGEQQESWQHCDSQGTLRHTYSSR